MYEPLHGFGDFDDFSELEPAQGEDAGHVVGEDELLRELDAYQYHGLEEEPLPENPYRTLEQLELGAPETLQQLLEQEQAQEQEQRDAPAKAKAHNTAQYNIRMQQKWARKRAQQVQKSQQQPQLQRNIFGQHFKQQRGKLALANSEATASKHLKAATRSGAGSVGSSSSSSSSSSTSTGKINEQQEKQTATVAGDAQQQQQQQAESVKQQQQQEQNQKESDQKSMHQSNHKRSGSSSGSAGGGYASPPVSHSVASQLMLRTARGQRQYDVPQIGE